MDAQTTKGSCLGVSLRLDCAKHRKTLTPWHETLNKMLSRSALS